MRGDHMPDLSTVRRMEDSEKSEGKRDEEYEIAQCTCGDPVHVHIREWPNGKWTAFRVHH